MRTRHDKSYSITEARKKLPSLVHAAEAGSAVELTRRGKPVAVLVSSKEFGALTGEEPDLFSAIESFRHQAALEELDVEEVYRSVRDRSPGRTVEL
jgi:prevent-host-death family protein